MLRNGGEFHSLKRCAALKWFYSLGFWLIPLLPSFIISVAYSSTNADHTNAVRTLTESESAVAFSRYCLLTFTICMN